MIEPGLESLAANRCPDCGNDHFWRGPSGGLSVNIECSQCGSRFNVCHVGRADNLQMILAQRIAHNGEWPDRGDWP